MKRKAFQLRAAVTIATVLSGLTLPVTGLVNHLLAFTPLTTTHHAWMAAHNVMGVVFVITCCWHVVYNRRQLANHFRFVVGKVNELRWELPVVFVVVASLFALAVGHAYLTP